jgi:uncharacterized protein
VRFYYASDIHGSERCWRKFLNAGAFYKVDALIMGGDIVGKAIVPIEEVPGGGFRASMDDRPAELRSEEQVVEFEERVRSRGLYPHRTTKEELARLRDDPAARERLFEEVVRRELRRWIAIAEEKARPGVEVYVMAGNDDPFFVDDELRSTSAIRFCDADVLDVDGYQLLSLSYANRTPWDSPRELDEDDLLERVRALAHRLRDPRQSIFNLHVPPYDTGLDSAARLDETLQPVTQMGAVELIPVGSTAVRRAIEEFQPLVSVHGHIHESRAEAMVGQTLAINPGSDYATGHIHGALVELRKGRVRTHQLVSG